MLAAATSVNFYVRLHVTCCPLEVAQGRTEIDITRVEEYTEECVRGTRVADDLQRCET